MPHAHGVEAYEIVLHEMCLQRGVRHPRKVVPVRMPYVETRPQRCDRTLRRTPRCRLLTVHGKAALQVIVVERPTPHEEVAPLSGTTSDVSGEASKKRSERPAAESTQHGRCPAPCRI